MTYSTDISVRTISEIRRDCDALVCKTVAHERALLRIAVVVTAAFYAAAIFALVL